MHTFSSGSCSRLMLPRGAIQKDGVCMSHSQLTSVKCESVIKGQPVENRCLDVPATKFCKAQIRTQNKFLTKVL